MSFKNLKEKNISGGIELYSNKEAIIEGCKGVTDYSAEYIRIDLGSLELKISGCNLVIGSYIYEQIDITGEIVSLEFVN